VEERPDFSAELEDENPSKELADLLRFRYGETMGFDEETCEEIATLPFPEAFEAAYSYLTRAEIDADEALSHFMEEPTDD
jgi:hypothetical protein